VWLCKNKSPYGGGIHEVAAWTKFQPKLDIAVQIQIERRWGVGKKDCSIARSVDRYPLDSFDPKTSYVAFSAFSFARGPDDFPVDISMDSLVEARIHDRFPCCQGRGQAVPCGGESHFRYRNSFGGEIGRRR